MKKLIQSSFVLFAVTSAVAHAAQSAQLYVATNGNDAWSGTLPSPNAGKTNGPLRTLQRARDVFRLNKPAGRKTIFVRGGTHFLQDLCNFYLSTATFRLWLSRMKSRC
jgi:hypothetical protein